MLPQEGLLGLDQTLWSKINKVNERCRQSEDEAYDKKRDEKRIFGGQAQGQFKEKRVSSNMGTGRSISCPRADRPLGVTGAGTSLQGAPKPVASPLLVQCTADL